MAVHDQHRKTPPPGRPDPKSRSRAELENRGDGTDSGGNGDWEGATEDAVNDTRGPGPGYDNEPAQEDDTGGVS